MRRSFLVVGVVLGSCGPGPVIVRAPVAAPVAPAPAAKPASIWPVPMRVMTWTPEGTIQIGTLPDAPPASVPATAWYVEPAKPLDDRTFAKVVAAVRSEHVPGLSLRDQPCERWLGALRDLPELTALILDDTAVDARALGAIDLPLERLYLARTLADDAAISTLRSLGTLAGLRVIDLEDTAVTDRGVAALVGFTELRAVNLAGTRITDAGGATLGALVKLQILDLGGTRVAAKTVAALRPLALRELFLDHTRVGKELGTLAAFAPGIVRFDVSALEAYKPTDADVGWLANAPNVIEVGLTGSKVHDKLVLAIAAAPGLREIRLAGAPITIAPIQVLAKRRDLEEIDLADTPVDDASAAAFVAMPHMRTIRLDGTPITDAALNVAPSSALEELYLSRTKIGDAGLAILDATPKLEALGLAEALLGDGSLVRIARLRELRTLVLSKARTGRGALAELGKLAHLERLYLDDSRAGDETLAALAPLRALRVLHLAGTDVSEAALPILRDFRRLDELTIGDTRVRGAIADLDAWPRLRTLSVQGLELTDEALPRIAKRTSLVTLDLSLTDVKDPAKLAALPHLRVLGLAQTRLSQAGGESVKALVARGVEVVR